MRTYFLRYAFISTYKSTIFVKRAGDSSFLLSEVFDHDRTDPSVRQLFAGFCMLAAGNPNYCEDRDLDVDIVRLHALFLLLPILRDGLQSMHGY